MQLLQRDRRSRHLHQAQDALLHPRPAGGGEQDVGAALRDRCTNSGNDGRAHGNAHRSAHEGEVLDSDHGRLAVDPALRTDQRVALAVRPPRRLQAFGVALGVLEPKRILANLGRWQELVFRGVEELLEALGRTDPVVEVAARADAVIFLPFLDEHHRPALGALVPQILRRLALGQERNAASDAAKPTHRSQLLASAGIWVSDAAMSMIARRGFGAPVIGRPMTRTEAPSPRASAGVTTLFWSPTSAPAGRTPGTTRKPSGQCGACRSNFGTRTDDPVEPGLAR